MEERNITVTLDKAKEWYKSGVISLKEIALQAFNEKELKKYNFKDIKTFKDACEALGLNYKDISIVANGVLTYSRASAAMFKLNIVRKALNLGRDLHLTKNSKHSYIYYPYNPFVTKSSTSYEDKLNSGEKEVIGSIRSKGAIYNVLGGSAVNNGGYEGLSSFYSSDGVGGNSASIAFLGCASKEIAQHFGKYFGMLITEAKFADMVDFEIIEDKYGNTK